MFKEPAADDQIDGLDGCPFAKSDREPSQKDSDDFLGGTVIKSETERILSDVSVRNGDVGYKGSDRNGEQRIGGFELALDGKVCEDLEESPSCDVVGAFLDERSVETSTETLVSEHICR